jgi:hypothetical protein
MDPLKYEALEYAINLGITHAKNRKWDFCLLAMKTIAALLPYEISSMPVSKVIDLSEAEKKRVRRSPCPQCRARAEECCRVNGSPTGTTHFERMRRGIREHNADRWEQIASELCRDLISTYFGFHQNLLKNHEESIKIMEKAQKRREKRQKSKIPADPKYYRFLQEGVSEERFKRFCLAEWTPEFLVNPAYPRVKMIITHRNYAKPEGSYEKAVVIVRAPLGMGREKREYYTSSGKWSDEPMPFPHKFSRKQIEHWWDTHSYKSEEDAAKHVYNNMTPA